MIEDGSDPLTLSQWKNPDMIADGSDPVCLLGGGGPLLNGKQTGLAAGGVPHDMIARGGGGGDKIGQICCVWV